jgi:hypothetical protein
MSARIIPDSENLTTPDPHQGDFSGYDIIGDLHGCSEALERLLVKLGYSKKNGAYCHPDRQVIFVGDLVDRGPHIREVTWLVHDMVQAGAAQVVMGNHEYNAIAYMTPRKDLSDHYLREHNARHTRIMKETLDQFDGYEDEWNYLIKWFLTMPLFLELPGFRVVHACWDQALIDEFKHWSQSKGLKGNCINEDFLRASADLSSFEFKVMDRLLRGMNLKLPDGQSIEGKDGFVRQFFRVKFWSNDPDTYQDIVFQPDPLPDHLATKQISDNDRSLLINYDSKAQPLFFGHYWRSGEPERIKPNLTCLDYSAVKYGKLVAYRFDGETEIDNSKFEYIDVTPEEFPLEDTQGQDDLSRV